MKTLRLALTTACLLATACEVPGLWDRRRQRP